MTDLNEARSELDARRRRLCASLMEHGPYADVDDIRAVLDALDAAERERDKIRRGIAAHVASEIERLADELGRFAGTVLNAESAAQIARARAAEIREGKTDGQ